MVASAPEHDRVRVTRPSEILRGADAFVRQLDMADRTIVTEGLGVAADSR